MGLEVDMKDLAIVVNTNTLCIDVWDMFFGQLKKHYKDLPKTYVFVDDTDYLFPDWVEVVNYNKEDSFTEQYYDCISKVNEKYCLYMNEDYVLYKDVDDINIKKSIIVLENDKSINFVKLIKGVDNYNINYFENFWLIPTEDQYIYTQQATIWETEVLKKIHEKSPNSGIGTNSQLGHLELDACAICRELGVKGVYIYNNENKRGLHHYDSDSFPFIASAKVKGTWNLEEYREELEPLMKEYKIEV